MLGFLGVCAPAETLFVESLSSLGKYPSSGSSPPLPTASTAPVGKHLEVTGGQFQACRHTSAGASFTVLKGPLAG